MAHNGADLDRIAAGASPVAGAPIESAGWKE